MRKRLRAPLGLLIITVVSTLFVEFFFMLYDENIAHWFSLSENTLAVLDAVFITAFITPFIYFLIIKRITRGEADILRLNESLLTDRKETEENRVKITALLASLGEGVVATDNNGVVTMINHHAEKILGWSSNEIIGKIFTGVVQATDENGKPTPADKRAISRVLVGIPKKKDVQQYQHPIYEHLYYTQKNGTQVPVKVTVTPIILKNKVIGAVEIFYDASKERQLEKTREDLLALASHQLRTPLSGTKWLIETLINGIHGPLTPPQRDYLNEIYKINERMTSLVSDMLGVIRMENSIIPINKSSVSTDTIIKNIMKSFEPIAKGKCITVQVEKDADHEIETDQIILKNILDCLISNAVNYSNIDGCVLLGLKKSGNEIVFSVKDTGIGIPRDEQKKLFERFFRASNAKIFNTKGTGLGLYIASLLSERIGAKLSFESEEGKGSTFYVHIPTQG